MHVGHPNVVQNHSRSYGRPTSLCPVRGARTSEDRRGSIPVCGARTGGKRNCEEHPIAAPDHRMNRGERHAVVPNEVRMGAHPTGLHRIRGRGTAGDHQCWIPVYGPRTREHGISGDCPIPACGHHPNGDWRNERRMSEDHLRSDPVCEARAGVNRMYGGRPGPACGHRASGCPYHGGRADESRVCGDRTNRSRVFWGGAYRPL